MTRPTPQGQAELRRLIDAALAPHRAGRLAEAEQLYRKTLQEFADQFEPNHLLGVVLHQQGRSAEGQPYLERAVTLDDASAKARNNLGAVHLALGRWSEAAACFERAVELDPAFADARYNLANALVKLGACERAVPHFERFLAAEPGLAEAHNNLGAAYLSLKRHDDAVACFNAALAIAPNQPEAQLNLGNALMEQKQWERAADQFRRAVALDPLSVKAHNNLGTVLVELHRPADAIASLTRALQLDPGSAEAHNNLGNAQIAAKNPAAAAEAYRQALALRPDWPLAEFNLGLASRKLGLWQEAVASFRRAQQAAPDDARITANLVMAMGQLCDWSDLQAQTERLLGACLRAGSGAEPFALLALRDDPPAQLAAARNYCQSRIPPPLRRFETKRPAGAPRGRLRLGYLSADFRQHPVASLIARLLELHDRSRFEVHAFSAAPDDGSALRARIRRAADHFHDVEQLTDAALADLINRAHIDILIDLGGHTENGRIAALSGRPAPVQISYLGYPGTTGAGFIDYALVDPVTAPPSAAGEFSERLAVLPDCFLPFDDTLAISAPGASRAAHGLPKQGFVFCSFNNAYKITPPVFDIWMRLLGEVPGAVLWLARSIDAMERNLRAEAAKRGTDPARLVFAGRLSSHADHMARHRLADLFLDTVPYNAHTTAVEALWAGLPVLTQKGRGLASRVAASLLSAVGLPELVTAEPAAYEALALKLAREPELLASLRRRLADARAVSSLFDAGRFRAHVEAAYSEMWARFARGEAPASFAVRPMVGAGRSVSPRGKP